VRWQAIGYGGNGWRSDEEISKICQALDSLNFGNPKGLIVSRRQMSDSLSGPEIAGLTGLLFMYNCFIAEITIAMIRVKQAFDGASSATENKFPVTAIVVR
jgi:hypothetical protein